MQLGNHDYQIMATEGYQSSGSSNITVGTSSGGGGGTSCTVSATRGQEWSDRFNVTYTVSGTNSWVVGLSLNGGQTIQNSWNTTLSGSGSYRQARPNGSGNSFGITVMRNGSSTTPSATCATG